MTLQEQRKIKGNNFSSQIENSQIFKKFIKLVFDEQKGEHAYPLNFIREIALTPLQIVEQNGKRYVKNYMYNGTLSHFEFLQNDNFAKAIEYVERPKIKKIK